MSFHGQRCNAASQEGRHVRFDVVDMTSPPDFPLQCPVAHCTCGWRSCLQHCGLERSLGTSLIEGCNDTQRNEMDLIRKWGYPAKEYLVMTEDGYVLSVCRIPHGRGFHGIEGAQGPPVLLLHGIISSAADWVINKPRQSIGFVLADAGYDVWLLNTRGSPYSKVHAYLDTSDPEYWDFSFDEIGRYDVPAVLNFILKVTGQSQLSLVTWSQGFTECLVMLSERPEYNLKVNLLIGMAPVGNVTNIVTPLTLLSPIARFLKVAIDFVSAGGLLRSNAVTRFLLHHICNSVVRGFCFLPISLSVGASHYQMNRTRIPVYMAHMPAGTTTKNLVHYAQMHRRRNFVKFDYGKRNVLHYGQSESPPYDLSNIVVPIALFTGLGDRLADVEDVEDLKKQLPSLVFDYVVSQDDFMHLDFVLGIHLKEILHDVILSVLGQFQTWW